MATPSKSEQDAEAAARQEQGIVPGEAAAALDTIVDGERGAPPAEASPSTPPEPGEPARTPPKPRVDDARNAIVARFRADRATAMADQADDITDFTRSGMPPEVEAEADPDAVAAAEPPADADLEPAPAPQTIKLKVRGQEQEFTLDEVIALARKNVATDDYFDEAKAKAKEAGDLLRDIKARAGQAGDPHAAQPAQPAAPAAPAAAAIQPQEDEVGKLMETMQFGDPADARALFDKTINDRVQQAVTKAVPITIQHERIRDDSVRTAKVLKSFEEKHADIAADRKARAAIEVDVYEQQLADLHKIVGDDLTKLTPDRTQPTPGQISVAHQWYRLNGFDVQPPDKLLETAVTNFIAWKGVKPTEPAAVPSTPRRVVDVVVDRTVRRQAVPQQPSRSAVARPAQPAAPKAPDRSAVIENMRKAREAPRGKSLVL